MARDEGTMKRKDDRVIIHFDYDCFYASVFEAQNPALKELPLAVQQKQIVVTCNYEARRRGLHKMQLITEAKKTCPEVLIVNGEDLTKFRDASKALFSFLKAFSWNGKVERLGFDEVFMDFTDLVDLNLELLNEDDLPNAFFCLSKTDPTVGFSYNASHIAGHTYGEARRSQNQQDGTRNLHCRLVLGSHLASYLRAQLEEHMGYTCTVGISTSKLLSKLVGNVNKPQAQTTLLPPYVEQDDGQASNVITFIDSHDIGKIPNIGFKMTHKLREHVLRHQALVDESMLHTGSNPIITARRVRTMPGMNSALLEKILSGPGMPQGVGYRTWCLLHGIDDTEVGLARELPRQISIEDSYPRLDELRTVEKELLLLSKSLIKRMRTDLTEDEEEVSEGVAQASEDVNNAEGRRRWLALPKTLRLSTRPRPPENPDGSRARFSSRISRSVPSPIFLNSLTETTNTLAERLVQECLMPLFRRLHPEKTGWDLSIVNVAVTNLVETAGDNRLAIGRDISKMFKNQQDHLKEWKVEDVDIPPDQVVQERPYSVCAGIGSEDRIPLSQASQVSYFPGGWDDEDEIDDKLDLGCPFCGARMPSFAMPAHLRFHEAED